MMAEAGAKEVVVARSLSGNEELRARLSRFGIESQCVETVRFAEPADWDEIDAALRNVRGFDWVVFTSPRGASSFLTRLRGLGLSAKGLGPKLAAVGPSTADALRKDGVNVDFVPWRYLTSELGEGIPEDSGRRVLLLRADIGEASLAATLKRRGFHVTDLAIYRTVGVPGLADPAVLDGARLVVFASPSEVRGFSSRLSKATLERLTLHARAACIGPVTAEAARAAGFRSVFYPEEHTIEGLVEKVRELISDA